VHIEINFPESPRLEQGNAGSSPARTSFKKGESIASIMIEFKDGTVERFPHKGRASGSYTKSIRYEGLMAIITDEWGKETAFPVESIKRIDVTPVNLGEW
jgi:hypothetical protein